MKNKEKQEEAQIRAKGAYVARRDGRNRGAGGGNPNAGKNANAGDRQNRRRNARIKVGYTDLVKHADGTFSLLLTAEVSGGDGSEQVQFFLDLDPKGNPVSKETEVSVDEYGHAQLRVAGVTSVNHIAKAMLVNADGEPYGTPSRCTIDLAKSPKLPDKLHAPSYGHGRGYVFIPVAVVASDDSPVKGALVDIYEVGERSSTLADARRDVPLFSLETDARGALNPVPCVEVTTREGSRTLLVHVAGTKLRQYVTCRSAAVRAPKPPADLPKVATGYKDWFFFTRTIRAFLRGVRMGGEALREQRKEGSK